MGVLRNLFGFGRADNAVVRMTAERPIAQFSIGLDSFPWIENEFGISREWAMKVPAVLAGRNQIVSAISPLNLRVLDADNNVIVSPLVSQIDPNIANAVTIAQTLEDLIFDGKSYWRVIARSSDGYPTYAQHVDHRFVSEQAPATQLNILPSRDVEGGSIWINGEAVSFRDVIKFEMTNPGLLQAGGTAIKTSLMVHATSSMYANSPTPIMYFTPTDNADVEDDAVVDLLRKWKAARQANTVGYVPDGFELHTVDIMNPKDLQLIEIEKSATLNIANILGLDPEDFGISTTSRTYQNAIDRRQDRINECFAPYMAAIEQRLSLGDVTKRGQRVCFDLGGFLKANPTDEAAIVTQLVAAKVITPDEGRERLNLPEMTPTQLLSITPPPAPAPSRLTQPNSGAQATADYSSEKTSLRFTADVLPDVITFDGADVAASFAVNRNSRTISGLVVPWNMTGRSAQGRYRFAPGSLKFNAAQVDRIKLLVDHLQSMPVGKCVKAWADTDGMHATFSVSRTPDGDKALAMAADGTRDGLSVGIGHDTDTTKFVFAADPSDPTVQLVTSAPWTETSLVAIPAFADARTSAVTFSAANPEGMTMPETTEQATATVAAPVAADTQSIAQIIEVAVQNGIAAGFSAVERPAVINPVRETAVTQVAEAPLYRFDGVKAQRCFTADLAAVAGGDQDAKAVVERFMANDMAAMFTNITPANVATLNPVPTRPELYVPNLTFNSPLRSLVTTGGLTDLVAFIVPKFSSSSGLVADHVTGTEPSDGTYVTTSQTVTPKGLSGRVDIDREVIDSGGSPQADQIIYGDMVREYTNQLETRIVTRLVSLSLSDTQIVGTDGDLNQALIDLFASFQFLRGGDSFNSLGLESGLYKAIAKAVDADGRPLFPMIGAVNADGSVSPDLTSVRVAEKTGVPAWALEAANSGPAKSYLFNRNSVYQWNSAPRRFTFDQVNVSSVAIGIWGYSAEAVTRSTDVYQLAYTAS